MGKKKEAQPPVESDPGAYAREQAATLAQDNGPIIDDVEYEEWDGNE